MKRILLLITLLLPILTAAQATKLLEIDASSFAPVQTDVLSGVAIDKIGMDPSRRPCARIKMHINRMSKEDINGLSVRTLGGSIVVTKCVVAAQGNGLIIELTAKSPTRFYLRHEKYGDSNEVSLNLEGNREYRLDASLKTTHSIVIQSNVSGADVYVDNEYEGATGKNQALTVKGVYPGRHSIRVVRGSYAQEIQVEVNDDNVHFRLDIETGQINSHFVIFKIEPAGASLKIDGVTYAGNISQDVSLMLPDGEHSYSVSADMHHTEKGMIVLDGSNIDKVVRLKPAYGWLQVSGESELRGASVYVDGKFIGTAPIKSDRLSSGEHMVRVEHKLYKPFEQTITICDQQTLDFVPTQAPILITGTVNIQSNKKADVYIDNKKVGKTPLNTELVVGEHSVALSRNGYRTRRKSITVKENQVSDVRILLTRDMRFEKYAGFINNFELGYGHHVGVNRIIYENVGVREYRTLHPIEFTYTIGYKFYNGIFCGLGSGVTLDLVDLRKYGDRLDPYYTQEEKSAIVNYSKVSLPIFANFKYYLTKSVFQPMVSASMGMYISLPSGARNMLLWDLGVGCNYRIDRKKGAYLMFSIGGVPNLWADRLDVERKSSFALRIKAGFAL